MQITSPVIYLSGAVKMLKLEAESASIGPTVSSDQRTDSALTVTTHQHKARSGLEAMESEGEREPAAWRLGLTRISLKVSRPVMFQEEILAEIPLLCFSQRILMKMKRKRTLKNHWKMRAKRT